MTTEALESAGAEATGGENSGGALDEAGKSTAGKPTGDDTEGNRLKRRNDELAGKWKAEKEAREKAEQQLADIEREKATTAEKLAVEQGKWEDVLAARDQKLADLTAKLAEKDTALQGLENGIRERSIIDRLTEAEGLNAPPAKVRRAYLGLVVDKGLDRYPDADALDKEAEKREKLLRKEYPELFEAAKPTTTGGSPPTAGKPQSKAGVWKNLR